MIQNVHSIKIENTSFKSKHKKQSFVRLVSPFFFLTVCFISVQAAKQAKIALSVSL